MRIIFFGTSLFAAKILESFLDLPHELVAIVTREDKPQGRDLKLGFSPVKNAATALFKNCPLFQPDKVSTLEFAKILSDLSPDLFFVVAYGEILKDFILKIPKKASVNLHVSLLPKLRGAAPMQRALMQGDLESGITFIEMALQMDAGDILLQKSMKIPLDMNFGEFEDEMIELSSKSLSEFLENFDQYYLQKQVQNEQLATYAPKILSEDAKINWNRSVLDVYNQIRALSPSPGAYTELEIGSNVKRFKILKASLESTLRLKPGELFLDSVSIVIGAQNGALSLELVQIEGKKEMSVKEFLLGAPKFLRIKGF